MLLKNIFMFVLSFLVILSCTKLVKTKDEVYWDSQKKGANYFNKIPNEEWFLNAKSNNIKLVRLAYDKWDGEGRDFLLGDADNYNGIVEKDLEKLINILDWANKCDIKIIITPLTLPGARWIQKNDGIDDGKLYQDIKYQEKAIEFWVDLVKRINYHPAVIAYNIINEPHPEKFYNKSTFWFDDYTKWYESIQNTEADLNLFYSKIISAIRKIDKSKFIILDSGLHATPWAFEIMEKQKDKNIMYSFHMYEPYDYTTERINKGNYAYPGEIYINDLSNELYVDKNCLEKTFLMPVIEWANKNKIPHNRIMVGEFGVSRTALGSDFYISDIINLFNKYKWHFLFYAFQEDEWDNMDYQFGNKKVPYKYWQYQEANTLEKNRLELYKEVKETPIWDILKKELTYSNIS